MSNSLDKPNIRWLHAGDGGWMIQFSTAIDPAINRAVRAWATAITAARPEGFVEAVPAFSSLSVFFDPLITDHEAFRIQLINLPETGSPDTECVRRLTLPCCYDPSLGWDIDNAAEELGLSRTQLIEAHSETLFSAYALGFMPGFAYMGGLDDALALPRLTSPRTKVPASSVAIAGTMAGVYPFDSPGGWRILGRTPLKMFDPQRDPAVVIEPGDAVQFTPISLTDFERLSANPPHPSALIA